MGFKVVSFEWGNISTNKKYLLKCRSCLQNLRGEHIENVISLILLLLFLLFYVVFSKHVAIYPCSHHTMLGARLWDETSTPNVK